jgi:3-hydroxyacyl-CoA dehydrogenase
METETLSRFSSGIGLEAVRDCDLIIEVCFIFSILSSLLLFFPSHIPFCAQAIAENMDLKVKFYKQLGELARSDAIFGQ